MKRTRIRPISDKRKKHLALRDKVLPAVWARDKGRCLNCGEPATEVHEIIPRSMAGNRTMERIFRIDNMCCICRQCHAKAANQKMRFRLLTEMQRRYNYVYPLDGPWREVLLRGEDG